MRLKGYIVLILISLLSLPSLANTGKLSVARDFDKMIAAKSKSDTLSDDDRKARKLRDTIDVEERNQRFYDSLKSRSNRNEFWRTLHKLMIVPKKEPVDPAEVIDETKYYARFEGKRIDTIEFERHNVYDASRGWIKRNANAIHVVTLPSTIKQDLLFKAGDEVDAEQLVKNKQLLQSRRYIYKADIVIAEMPDDSTAVRIKVITRDKWTIAPKGSIKGGLFSGRMVGEIYDANLLGLGNKFSYKISVDWSEGRPYKGSVLEYNIPNTFGTFFESRILTGKSFDRRDHFVSTNKKFITYTDYEAGALFNYEKAPYYLLAEDEKVSIRFWEADFWLGKSFELKKANSSVYGMARYHRLFFKDRPEIGPDLNPDFNNHSLFLASLGIYREKFLTANLVYGYGSNEYIATGYRMELVGGYRRAEYNSGYYGEFSFKAGEFTPIGYFMGDFGFGSFYDFGSDRLFRSALSVKVDYFTNLLGQGRTRMRQFISLDYMGGFRREEGSYEWITFTKESGPRGFRDYAKGRNRMVLSTESVIFTPWQPLGFRVALVGFVDLGLLGNDPNVFRNNFYSTFGVGIRLKNERFIFSTIQLKFSLALGKNGLLKNDWIRLGTQKHLRDFRYLPSKPEILPYK